MNEENQMSCSSEEEIDYQVCVQSITDNIHEALKCFKCREYCHPPFEQTTKGKLICPFCLKCFESGINIMPQRTLILERMYSILQFPCKNKLFGCKFEDKGAVLEGHHKVCQYVYLKCPYKCAWRGRPKQLIVHLKIHHADLTKIKIYGLDTTQISLQIASDTSSYHFNTIIAFGKVSAVCLIKDSVTKTLCYIATNMETFDTARYEWRLDFLYQNGQKTTKVLNVTQSNNKTREKFYALPRHELPFDAIDEIDDIGIFVIEKPRRRFSTGSICQFGAVG
ncbi:hypothetical protein WA026_011358 [Henosepilachna vigintioctopunctata]|uniref:SIAH-type domain-containing protein n=1 Tax=Henosepilachna vigintioctopunctata TaxID=420089 RepID=A0AAW1TJF7_9CUCU